VQPTCVVSNAAAWEAVARGKQRIKPNYRRRVTFIPISRTPMFISALVGFFHWSGYLSKSRCQRKGCASRSGVFWLEIGT
jgi:hypothetical protein